MTYTFAILEVSPSAHAEIASLLKAAGHEQAIDGDGTIDMRGLALVASAKCDSNVRAVVEMHMRRAAKGLKKYGVTTDRDDLSLVQWLTHAQEEAMDHAVYLERAKKDVQSLEAKAAVLEALLSALVVRLDEVHEHPAYKGVWGSFAAHGGRYAGPQYKDELDAARRFLEAGQ